MKTREELQTYIDNLFTQFDFITDEYQSDKIDALLCHEITNHMCRFISPDCALKNMITKERGYNIL